MTETFSCPRRAEVGYRLPGDDGVDTYKSGHGLVGQPRGCSYCGSLPPEEFLDHVRAGAEVDPTDKSYKLYLTIPSEKEGELRILGHSTHAHDGYRGWSELSRAEKKLVKSQYDDQWHRKNYGKDHHKTGGYLFTTWGEETEAKFYTTHLSEEQGWEFHRLWASHQINWGYPGHPYTRLYIPGPSGADPEDPRLRKLRSV